MYPVDTLGGMTKTSPAAPAYTYAATLDRWVDGDTAWLTVDLGFRTTTSTDFRLWGINTPEHNQPGFHEATAFAEGMAPAGSAVMVQTYKDPDKYGRWLAEVFTPEGKSVNDALIAAGLAQPYFGGHKDPFTPAPATPASLTLNGVCL